MKYNDKIQILIACIESIMNRYFFCKLDINTPEDLPLLFSEARDDTAVPRSDIPRIAEDYADPDSLNYNQIVHMDRTENVIDLAYKNRFRFNF